jgi:hypothetical protein
VFPDKVISIIDIVIIHHFRGVQYTSGGDLKVYSDQWGVHNYATAPSSAYVNATDPYCTKMTLPPTQFLITQAPIFLKSDTSNPQDGDGPISVSIMYRLLDTVL